MGMNLRFSPLEWNDSTKTLTLAGSGNTFVVEGVTDLTGGVDLSGGIHLDTANTTQISITGGVTAISVSANTGTLLNAAPTATGAGLKIHTHLNSNNSGGVAPNDRTYINEFKGEFISTSGVMVGTGAIYELRGTGTGSLTSVLGDATLYTGITLSGSAYPTIGTLTGGQFTANVSGTLSGTGVLVTGLYGGIGACTGSTLTTAAYMSAIWGDYKSVVELGTGTSSILLLTHNGTAVVDYGIKLEKNSTGAITTGLDMGAVVTGIKVTGNTGVLINAAPATTGGGLKIHTHANVNNSGGTTYDLTYINEFKGEFTSTTGLMYGVGAIYAIGTTAGAMSSTISTATLSAGATLSGTNPATGSWLSGGLFQAALAATSVLNGTAVMVAGIYAELNVAANVTLTAASHICGAYFQTKLASLISSGESEIVLLAHGGTQVVNQAIYLSGGATVNAFATIDAAASGKAIETCTSAMSTNATSHALHIKIGSADGYIPVYDNNTWA